MADTDIAIIHLSNFHHIRAAEIWTSLKAGKTTKMISLNTITTNLGTYSLDQTVLSSCSRYSILLHIDAQCNFQLLSTLHSKHRQVWKNWQQTLSLSWTKTNLTKPLIDVSPRPNEDGKILPFWTTLPLSKDVFHLDVKCTCPIVCSQCKRMTTKLKCTHQSKCTCEK